MRQKILRRYRKGILKYGTIIEKHYPPNWWDRNGFVVLNFQSYDKKSLAITCEGATRYDAYKSVYYTIKQYKGGIKNNVCFIYKVRW